MNFYRMNTWNIFFPRNKYLRYLKIKLGKITNVNKNWRINLSVQNFFLCQIIQFSLFQIGILEFFFLPDFRSLRWYWSHKKVVNSWGFALHCDCSVSYMVYNVFFFVLGKQINNNYYRETLPGGNWNLK